MTASGPAVPSLGSLLAGRYRLEQVVGRGGMADVYRAADELLGRTVAVKLMRAGLETDGERARVDVEMRTLARLRHPGLVTLFDAGAGDDSSGGSPYLVMDFIAGPTLRQRTSSGPLSPGEVAANGHDIAQALRYVHQNGVVHRDVKPANILLDPATDGGDVAAARLTDFGIAQVAEHTRHTVQGTTVGTANYLSPEQARGVPLAAASDTYSFGLVLLEALTGQLAFPGVGIEAAVARLHRDPVVPPDLDPRWQELLRAMTAQQPGDRPDDAWVVQRLAELAGRPMPSPGRPVTSPLAVGPSAGAPTLAGATVVVGAAPAGDTTLLAAPSRRSRRTVWILGAAVVAVVLAAVLVAVVVGSNAGSGSDDRAAAGPSPSRSTPASSRSTSSSAAAATYADVDGRLGRDLRRAEALVRTGGSGLQALRSDLQALARDAAAGHHGAARTDLADVETDAAAARAAGSISDARLTQLRAVFASLTTDLARTRPTSSAPSTGGQRTTAGTRTTPAGPGPAQLPPGQQKKRSRPAKHKKPGGPGKGKPGGPGKGKH